MGFVFRFVEKLYNNNIKVFARHDKLIGKRKGKENDTERFT